jgi:hypothetical protein
MPGLLNIAPQVTLIDRGNPHFQRIERQYIRARQDFVALSRGAGESGRFLRVSVGAGVQDRAGK